MGVEPAELLPTLPVNEVPVVIFTVWPSTVSVLAMVSIASISPRTALVNRNIVAVPLEASTSTVMPTCRFAVALAASSLSPSSTWVCVSVANSLPFTNTLPKPVMTPLAPAIPDDELPEEPPPHAARIAASRVSYR